MLRDTRPPDDKLLEIFRNRHHPRHATHITIGQATLQPFGIVILPMHCRYDGDSHDLSHQASIGIRRKLMGVDHGNALFLDKCGERTRPLEVKSSIDSDHRCWNSLIPGGVVEPAGTEQTYDRAESVGIQRRSQTLHDCLCSSWPA